MFITAHDDAATQRSLEASGARVLRKPVEESALIDAVSTAIRGIESP